MCRWGSPARFKTYRREAPATAHEPTLRWEAIMRSLASTPIALAVAAAAREPASAFDGRSAFEPLQRNLP
jgi:hypothetical protein